MRKELSPKSIPDPRPRYTQGILAEGKRLLFIAGQTGVDADNNVVGKGDVAAQTEQVLKNMKAVLDEAGASFADIVKITTYITDPRFRDGLNPARLKYFGDNPPASTLVVVSGLADPDYLVEIEAIAVLPD
ncbi:MAG: RidA family protein [Deltaproteobacteria bacterium]|nr:RidA family protein [Deltaproteobacteria bacterium]MDE0214104.1 RidA family protein [Deltaproteobacteria bacterium]